MPTSTVYNVPAAPPKPFKVADGTGPIRILYSTANTWGGIAFTEGRLAEKKGLSIQLADQATGPDWVNIEVFVEVPGQRVAQPLGTFRHRPGRGGVYTLDAEDMEVVAKNFVALVSSLGYYSAAHPVPVMKVGLRVTGDNPKGNASRIYLARALDIQPDLVVQPMFSGR